MLTESDASLLQENFEQKHDLIIEETELKQVVYVFGCNNSTVQIKSKINSIIIGERPDEQNLKLVIKVLISDDDHVYVC